MTFHLRSKSRNLALGVIEAGSASLLAAIVLGATVADLGQSIVSTVIATALPLAIGVYVVVTRYLPMYVTLDATNDVIEFRNPWRSGRLRWSDVEHFGPTHALVGYDITKAMLRDQTHVKLCGAPFEDFVRRLREISEATGR